MKRGAPSHQTVVRTYKGHQQSDAVRVFQRDADKMAQHGYFPVSQSWAQGQWGCGAFLIAIVLFVFLIGILIFIYMLLVKPEGTLTVTYQLQPVPVVMQAPPVAPVVMQVPQPASLSVRLNELDVAARAGLISEAEYHAKRAELLRRH